MASIFWDVQTTPWGEVCVAAAEDCLVGCTLPAEDHRPLLKELKRILPDETFAQGRCEMLTETFKELREYFSGKRMIFEVPIFIFGTEFQRKVWKALVHIPYGHTLSYGAVAKKIKHPKAVRAVGMANNKNRVPIIVPCHRVIASDGDLGGYAGGAAMKRRLLELEFNRIAS